MTVAERLVRARGERKREEVAQAVGISLSAVAMYENGERSARDEIKIRLAEFYGMNGQELFFNQESHEK